MFKKLLSSIFFSTTVFALPLDIGDTAPDFTIPICANGEGNFSYYDVCNGAVNGGNYKVSWIILFTSW